MDRSFLFHVNSFTVFLWFFLWFFFFWFGNLFVGRSNGWTWTWIFTHQFETNIQELFKVWYDLCTPLVLFILCILRPCVFHFASPSHSGCYCPFCNPRPSPFVPSFNLGGVVFWDSPIQSVRHFSLAFIIFKLFFGVGNLKKKNRVILSNLLLTS